MAKHVSLLRYLPHTLRDYEELRRITRAEEPEMRLLWGTTEKHLEDAYILTASPEALKIYEALVGVTAAEGDSLEERRARVLMLWNDNDPYTMRTLRKKLDTLYGAGRYDVELYADRYHIKIILYLEHMTARTGFVLQFLREMIPANLGIGIDVQVRSRQYIGIHRRELLRLMLYPHTVGDIHGGAEIYVAGYLSHTYTRVVYPSGTGKDVRIQGERAMRPSLIWRREYDTQNSTIRGL